MSIDPARAKSLFFAASEIADATQRKEYLDRECGSDLPLRKRVEDLLRANEGAPSIAGEDVPATIESQDAPPATRDYNDSSIRVGSLLAGRYKLLEAIGAGGMGTVLMAQQIEPVKRTVAIKVVKAGMDSKAVLARFEAERQALAMMDHPNIAKVLDAGTTEGGRPFFVMELVRGVPITQFCDERKLNPRQRLELFVPVCQAIQHAHQKGIIHRDIKPSNVLVAMYDDRAVPKVIDFGVAKATSNVLTESSLVTGFGTIVGTPEYMSPEQAVINNLDIDSRSDVYSLGVLLYELLTGTTPVDRKSLGQAALLEILRIVREVEAPRPSAKLSGMDTLPNVAAKRGVEPAKLSKLMVGDLDWVVLKALEKDRARRYETANAFARDIQRYLADEFVEARPPSSTYRLQKFIRKHRAGVAFAIVLASTLLIATVLSSTLALWAYRAENDMRIALSATEAEKLRAQAARDRTRQALDDMTSTITGEVLATQNSLTEDQQAFLSGVLKYYQEFADEEATDEGSKKRVTAAAIRVALIEHRLGRSQQAIEAYQKACILSEALSSEFPDNREYLRLVVRCHSDLGLLLAEQGKLSEARQQLDLALTLRMNRANNRPLDEQEQVDMAMIEMNQGFIAASENNVQMTLARYQHALEMLETAMRSEEDDDRTRLTYARCLGSLGWVRQAEQKFDLAEELIERSIAEYSVLLESAPNDAELIAGKALCHGNLANVYTQVGNLAGAAEQYRSCLQMHQFLADRYPNIPQHRLDIANIHNSVGLMFIEEGKWPEARTELARAVEILEELIADGRDGGLARALMVKCRGNTGRLFAEMGDLAAAELEHRQALEIIEQLVRENAEVLELRLDQSILLNNLGCLLVDQDKYEEAEAIHRQGLKLREQLVRETNAAAMIVNYVAYSQFNLGIALFKQRRMEEAQSQFETAIETWSMLRAQENQGFEYDLAIASVKIALGELQVKNGEVDDAISNFDRATKTLAEVVAIQSPHLAAEALAEACVGRTHAFQKQGQFEAAIREMEKALAFDVKEDPPRLRVIYAEALALAGQIDEAVSEADLLVLESRWQIDQTYELARVYGLASAKESVNQATYANEALRLLATAIHKGFDDRDRVVSDQAWDSLRDRDDFKAIVEKLN